MPVPQPCWKLRPIRLASVPRSASSAFCIPGDRLCSDTRTSTVSYPVVDCRLITRGGSARHPSFFLPVRVLSRVFRGKFVAGLRRAFQRKQLVFFGPCQSLANEKAFAAFLRTLFREDWVVYAKAPFGGPEHVLQYLARYTHRVAISNHRLLSVDGDHVTFRWKDYAHHSKYRAMTLTLEEFLRRFLQHVLPKGLPRIRYFGWLANRRRGELLPLCRRLLAVAPPPAEANLVATAVWQCPICGSPMRVVDLLTAAHIQQEQGHQVYILDSS